MVKRLLHFLWPIMAAGTLFHAMSINGYKSPADYPVRGHHEIRSVEIIEFTNIFYASHEIFKFRYVVSAHAEVRPDAIISGIYPVPHFLLFGERIRETCARRFPKFDAANFYGASTVVSQLNSIGHTLGFGALVGSNHRYYTVPPLCLPIGVKVALGYLSGTSSLLECCPNEPYANRTQTHTYERSDAHYSRPQGGAPLGYKIVLISLVITALEFIFCGCLLYAYRLFERGDGSAGLGYLVAGVFGIIGYAVLGYLLVDGLML